jgi:hypothetical protein
MFSWLSSSAFRPLLVRRPVVGANVSRRCFVTLGIAVLGTGTSTLLLSSTIRLDAPPPAEPNTVKDPATGVEFPSTLRIPSRFPLPTYTLLGVGVRKVLTAEFSRCFDLTISGIVKVSFLNINVYSVGFYADLTAVPPVCLFLVPIYAIKLISFWLKISRTASFDEKIRHLVANTSCVMRIGA